MPLTFRNQPPFDEIHTQAARKAAESARPVPGAIQPLAAGETVASMSRTVAKAPKPAAPRAENSGEEAQSLPVSADQSPTATPVAPVQGAEEADLQAHVDHHGAH
ncbi:hypothetical protein ABT174_14920 [Streptomyces sparsogenes]|uniref:hypothetical protein n=1 Tax=Streptomyces sparsogenes TaxID=67365 RepID=UPI003332AEF7